MKRIGVECASDCLFQKIKLILLNTAECVRVGNNTPPSSLDILLKEDRDALGRVLRISGQQEALRIPFERDSLILAVSDSTSGSALSLDKENRSAILKGDVIKLTELEYKLLELLLSDGGRLFTKDEILEALWENGTDPGVVNVYVHYLREKLECRGERIITSVRGRGYRIDERFIGGGADHA